MNIRERIYENTRALAKVKNLSMKEIEDEVGVSSGYLSKVSKHMSIEKIEKLSNVLGVSIGELTENDFLELYKKELAESELQKAVERAKKAMRGFDVLEIVNRILEDSNN